LADKAFSAAGLPEKCASPLRLNCGSTDIALYIYFGGRKLPICWKCWRETASSGLQWSPDSSERELAAEVERVENAIVRRMVYDAFSELAERMSKKVLREERSGRK